MDQLFRETNRVRRPGEMYDDDSETDEKADGTKKAAGTRPSFIAEIFTILTLIFAGETILPLIHPVPASSHASHSIPPSAWLTNPTPLVMFTIVHYLVSRTGLNKFVPTKMSALWETALAGFDALGRSIVVCTFFVDAFLQKPYIASNWYTVIILTWIGVYGGGLVVNALDMFSSEWKFQTPGEFKPWGWTTVDFWVSEHTGTLKDSSG
ncbi:hypothetical protein [Phaffia rhodozyma]|uniref:Uncharacterized protein n=1 Tax=Phaffia rhodozyma TaxID=264483 RepID=A0A0F7SJI1_PHARH|nr:hypothetical protein [Phaffia rhodozyma]